MKYDGLSLNIHTAIMEGLPRERAEFISITKAFYAYVYTCKMFAYTNTSMQYQARKILQIYSVKDF